MDPSKWKVTSGWNIYNEVQYHLIHGTYSVHCTYTIALLYFLVVNLLCMNSSPCCHILQIFGNSAGQLPHTPYSTLKANYSAVNGCLQLEFNVGMSTRIQNNGILKRFWYLYYCNIIICFVIYCQSYQT